MENWRIPTQRCCFLEDFTELYDIKNNLKAMIKFTNKGRKNDLFGAIINYNCNEKLIDLKHDKKFP